jgi:hypothetical protein
MVSFDPTFLGVKAILTRKIEVRAFKTDDKVVW